MEGANACHHQPEIIPKDDPYYLEMLELQKQHHRRAKENQNQSANKSYIFNHPMLKCYHNRQAVLKKNQITEDNYKQKVFLLHKWDFLKQIKAILIQ